MFYRVGKFKHELGKTDEIMEFFKIFFLELIAFENKEQWKCYEDNRVYYRF